MRTPGEDDALAAGFAWTEGILDDPEDLEEVRVCLASQIPENQNVAELHLAAGAEVDPARSLRTGLISGGCSICGTTMVKAVEAARRVRAPRALRTDLAALEAMVEALDARQDAHADTGGLHAAGLFTPSGELVHAAEDVGRHNAVDKVVGRALLEGPWPPPPVLVTTSRGSFDIVQKAAIAGVELVAFASAPSSLAVDLATACGMTLVGFLRPGRCNVYCAPERLEGTEA